VTATIFGATGAQAAVWTQRAGSTTWRRAGAILPPGFGSSYDPAAAAAPGGPLLLVAGTAPAGEKCIANGSVALERVGPRGPLGPAALVSDQRGTGSFDDRPMVAAGPGGLVWVAWSQGPDANACQDIGTGDRIEVAVSHDGGLTFGAPAAMPSGGGHSAFGVRLVPLAGGQAVVSWTAKTATGDQEVLVTMLGADGQPGPPQQALRGESPPLILPGASFYDFPAGDVTELSDGRLVVAAPFWADGRSVIKLAVGTPGGQWQQTTVTPPADADLLLPALGLLSSGELRLVCAVHHRSDDRLGYDWAGIDTTHQDLRVGGSGLTALTPAPPGPGFFELGEELALTPATGGLLTAVVVAGQSGATLETAAFPAPPAAAASPRASAGSASPTGTGAAGSPGTSGNAAPGTLADRTSHGQGGGSGAMTAWLAAALVGAAAAGAVVLMRRRRLRRW
jgi:hypothetical protein